MNAPVTLRGKGDSTSSASLWKLLLDEAEKAISADRRAEKFLRSSISSRSGLEDAVAGRIAARLRTPDVEAEAIERDFRDMLEAHPEWTDILLADIAAFYERDPACDRFLEPILYFKGFHAIQTHRLANWLLEQGSFDSALYLQTRSSEVFQTDINPAARIGKGLFLDHATGLVVGETASIGEDVSILHGVTLGGTGKESGDRHPKIGDCVLIGAGATILGNIRVGSCSRVAAGSLVVKPVPEKVTVAGVPSRVVGVAGCPQPSRAMDQILAELPEE